MSISALVVSSVEAPVTGAVSTQVVLNVEMQESFLRTHARGVEIRPLNTSKAYSSRQQESQEWCNAKGFIDGHTVTGNKIAPFP